MPPPSPAAAALAPTSKKIDWYTERCGGQGADNATTCAEALRFATVTHAELVDGVIDSLITPRDAAERERDDGRRPVVHVRVRAAQPLHPAVQRHQLPLRGAEERA